MSDTYKKNSSNVVSLCDYRKNKKKDLDISHAKLQAWMDFYFSTEDPADHPNFDIESFTYSIEIDPPDLDIDD